MFVYTAKLSKKKIALTAVLLILAIAAVILLTRDNSTGGSAGKMETHPTNINVKTNEQRVEYLKSLGWEIKETAIEEQKVIIPAVMEGVYAEYSEMQKKQGFELSSYAGKEATRYTYEVLNYPNAKEKVVADLLIYKGKVIAGDIQCVAVDGFMHGLAYPSSETMESTS